MLIKPRRISPGTRAISPPASQKLEDFQTLEAYQEALTDWKLDERERLQREKQARDATEQALRAEQDGWKAKERAARKAHPDYDDLMDTVEIPADRESWPHVRPCSRTSTAPNSCTTSPGTRKNSSAIAAAVTGVRGDGYRSIISFVIPCLS